MISAIKLPNSAPASHIAARVIPAIGRPDFPAQLLAVYRELADCDLCSAFLWESHRPKLLFAAGPHPRSSGFALSASRAYEQRYWQVDSAVERTEAGGTSLVCMNASDIRDWGYRRDCYQSGGISERLTLFDTNGPTISVSGYRSAARGPIPSRAIQRMEEAAPTLIAALRRHHELTEQASRVVLVPSRKALMQWGRDCGLSEREAEVVAGLAAGESQADIARRCGLTLNSVITYRRRAYQKLRVSDRRELKALCDRSVELAAT